MEINRSCNHKVKFENHDVVDWLLCGNRHQMFDLGRLPPEDELRRYFRSSRAVIREVLQEFARIGVLERRRSTGTYSDKPFEEKLLGMERDPGTTTLLSYFVLSSEVVAGNAVSDAIFSMNSDLLKVERVTYLGENPLGYWVMYLPADVGRAIPQKSWNENIQYLVHFLADGPVVVKYEFTAVLADDYVAHVLDIPTGCPLLHVERSYYKDDKLLLASFGRRVGVRLSLATELQER